MKAPDKIYMPNELLSEDWQRHIEGQDTCYIRKKTLIDYVVDCIAENLEDTTPENRDNHEGYHQACWDILRLLKRI